MLNRTRRFAVRTACLTAFLLLATAAVQAGGNRTVTVDMNEPFVINGTKYAANSLVFKQIDQYSPITTINEVWVGGKCLGMVMTRQTSNDENTGRDQLIFRRDDNGVLTLEALALRGEPTRVVLSLQPVTTETPFVETAVLRR